ncbi:MAG: biotin synthase BioB [Elusimicrobiota bacterium]
MSWEIIAQKALLNQALTKEEALSILKVSDSETFDVVAAAAKVRHKFFGKRMKLNYLVNIKSGLCPEDCHYCSQSKVSDAEIPKYPLLDKDSVIEQVERGISVGAKRACLVASGRGPSEKEMNHFCDSVKALKEKYPHMEVCACLGLLSEGQADKLKDSGVYAYNHNINTSKAHYEKICGTHTYSNRLDTVEKAKCGGLSACSGVLAGMGETDEDLVEMAFTLRDKKVDSIPVNFLVSIDKTPLEGTNNLNPLRCLKILALFRLTNPTVEIRVSGGREVHLRHLQPVSLTMANSIFIGDYLTTIGQSPTADLEMIRDLGYQIEGQDSQFLEKVLGTPAHAAALKD